MLKKKTSIHDIARDLNVSATTVSFVLNGKAEERKISSALKKRILEYVDKIGYRPNHIAQSLRTGKSKIIGMLVEDISDPFFSSIARIVEENLYKLGYKIFHSSTDNDTDRTLALLQIFRERQVDGYIIAPSPGIESDIQELLNDSKPVIFFDRYFPSVNTTNVIIDNMGGSYSAVEHLVENGYTNIAFVTLDSEQIQMIDRLKGYNKAMNEHKLPKFIEKIDYNEYKTDPGKMAARVKNFLLSNPSIDSVIFATNYLAISGLQVIRDLGIKIPDKLGVVGFDDNTHFSMFSPSVTAVAQPVEEISKHTVQELIRALTNGEKGKKRKTTVLKTELIVRESSIPTAGLKKRKHK